VLIGVIPPFVLQTDDNPKRVPGAVFHGIKQAIVDDRYAYFDDFFANFYNTRRLRAGGIGDSALRASFQVAAGSSQARALGKSRFRCRRNARDQPAGQLSNMRGDIHDRLD
jgi:hypothetical protein